MSAAPAVQPAPPSDEEIRTRLRRAFPHFRALVEDAAFRPEWKWYGAKYGWSLKLFEKKRNLCFLGLKEGAFDAAIIFGDRVREAALGGSAAEDVKALLRDARHYPEGWGVRVTVAKKADLELVRRLLEIKRTN